MTMSDISGISDINRSMSIRGTSITVVSVTARIGISQLPPFRNEISAMNWVGPSVDAIWRPSVKGFTTSISPSWT